MGSWGAVATLRAMARRGPARRLVSAVAAAGLLVAGACGSTSEQARTEPAEVAGFGALPTVAGGQLDLSSLEGRDVLLWFWAPW